jgi:hypothetical protein
VNFQVRRWRLVLRVLVLALIVAAVPLPSMAGQANQPVVRPGLKASIAPAVHAIAATTKAPARAAKTQGADTKAQPGSTSFFRTPAGIAVLAIVGAGAGYAMYSASHDRIHSVVRQGQ